MVISTMPRKDGVPAGRPRIRVFPTRAARYIGCAVSDREGLDGLDTHPTSQISGRLGYAIGKTRNLSNLGFAYLVAGRYEEALVPLKKALTLVPNYAPVHNGLAG